MRRFSRLFLFFGFLSIALFMSIPALAEFDSTRQTSWGVQTKGNSDTIGQWAALAWEVDQVGGTVFVGGNYLEVTNGSQVHSQPYLSAYDADTGAWQSWFRPEVGSAVFAMEPTADGGLLVGGEIDTWNGETVGSLVKIDPATGERWPGFQTRLFGGNAVVRDLKLEADGFVYAVGDFPKANDGGEAFDVGGAVRFNPLTGAIDRDWTPTIQEGTAWGVSRSKEEAVTYIAGFFQQVNDDEAARGFVGLDDDGAVVTNRDDVPFNGCTPWNYCSQLYDVEATDAGHLWIAGVEHALYIIDEADGSLIKHHYTACNPALNDCAGRNWAGGEFQEIERVGDRIYAGCHCWHDLYSDTKVIMHRKPTGDRTTVKAVAAFSAATGELVPEFQPELRGDSGAFGIHVNPSDGCMWIAGGFTSYGSPGGAQPPSYDVARICDENGPGPAASPAATPPPPLDCTATADPNDETSVVLDWTATSSATSSVIFRSVDGGTPSWAGRAGDPAETEFEATAVANSQSSFFVLHVYPGAQRSAQFPCGSVDLRPNLTPATECVVTEGPDGSAAVSWTAGNDNTDYIVRRSVDGSPDYWRARTTTTSFTDNLITPGRTYTFAVDARGADGTLAERTPCAPSLTIALPQPDVVAACEVVALPDNTLSVRWADGAATDRYVIRRSVDGGPLYWRARTDSPGDGSSLSYTDTSITLGRSYTYTVESIGAGNAATAATDCAPTGVTIEPPAVTPPTGCSLDNGVVTWTTADGEPADVIVERARVSPDPTSYGWRARLTGLSFIDDRVQPGSTYSYRVRVVGADGRRSDPAYCS